MSLTDLKEMANIVNNIEEESKIDNNLTPLDMFRRYIVITKTISLSWILAQRYTNISGQVSI